MDNKIRIGDNIKFLDSEGRGKVISILGNSYIILTNEGFEEKHSINAIIKVNEDLEKSLKKTYVPDGFKKLTKKVQKDSIFKSKTPLVWEIDIHIENLLDNFYHMSNYEIVNYQLDKCENIIHKALKAKVHKLVIIHGKGQGVLRKEVSEYISDNNLGGTFNEELNIKNNFIETPINYKYTKEIIPKPKIIVKKKNG